MSAPAVTVEAYYAQVPEALLYDPAVCAEAVRVYGVLHRYGNHPGNCYPSYATIAAHVAKSERSIPGWIRSLEEAGWILRVPRWRKGDTSSTAPPDGEEGWEPTSNGYHLFTIKRADGRGVYAQERAPLRADAQGGSALARAPKESHLSESQVEPEMFADCGTFEAFWEQYPPRAGRKVGKAQAERIWDRLTGPQRAEVIRCLPHYATACNTGSTLAKDAHRWLRPDVWQEWRDAPAAVTPIGSPRQRRAADSSAAFVGDDQPTGAVGRAFFRDEPKAVGR